MTDEYPVSAPVNLHEYEVAARALLPPAVYGFFAGGAEDEVTLRANRVAFEHWRLLPRVLRAIREPDLATTVLGQSISLPVMLTPLAYQRLVHAEGELAAARAARTAGTIFTLSTSASSTIEDVAAQTDQWWFQLYVQREREVTRSLVQRAEAAGAGALVITVDFPVLGRRESDLRYGFTVPERANVVDRPLAEGATHSWALGWDDLEWIASLSQLPIVLKGILAAEDAVLAIEHGARGIVVSNHGGRQLDSAVAALDALPAIVAAVESQAEIYLDGGIRRGVDVLKALALGARAVLLGRPFVWGLTVRGEAGVAHVLELLRAEIAMAMTLSGCAHIEGVTRALVVPEGVVERR
jgi:4-hydroxymandelate oxidase